MQRASLGIIIFLALIFTPLTLPAMETTVEVSGPDTLIPLKTAIEKSVPARCIAKGIDLAHYTKLTITLVQLGENISLDAILSSTPPQAFHKDLKGIDTISPALDEMIAALFLTAPPAAAAPTPAAQTVKPAAKSIDLDFQAVSVTVMGNTIFLADEKTIYLLKDNTPSVWWRAPGKDQILRITAYQGSIIALANHQDAFVTYRITNGRSVQEWPRAVTPIGNSLLSATLKIAPDNTFASNRWTSPTTIEGPPVSLPIGTDILGTTVGDILPENAGPEIITFSLTGKLIISAGKTKLWTSEKEFARLPLSLQEEYIVREVSKDDPSEIDTRIEHYYMPPRFLSADGMLIIINNNPGLWGMAGIMQNLKIYASSQVLGYAWTTTDAEERVLAKTSLGYCADIATQGDSLLALIVKKKGSVLMFASLKG